MKLRILAVLLLLVIPIAYSEISIKKLQDAYNLGEDIAPELKVTFSNMSGAFSGFQKAEIKCPDYYNDYYKVPFNVDTTEKTLTVKMFPLKTFSQMKGECELIITIQDMGGNAVEQATSDEFIVTDVLSVSLKEANLTLNPSDTLILKGSVYNKRSEAVEAKIHALIGNKGYNFTDEGSSFSLKLPVPDDIPSGENDLLLSFEDADGNTLTKMLTLEIIPRPTLIDVKTDAASYLPGDKVKAKVHLLDQANDSLEKDLQIKILKDKQELYSIEGYGYILYALNSSTVPGTYKVVGTYEKMIGEGTFEVLPLLKLKSSLDGETVVLENIGNVNYDDYVTVGMNSAQQNITLKKKVFLKPQTMFSFDLSKEVTDGDYTVTLPSGEIIGNVHLTDSRNFLKRTFDGIRGISGNAVTIVDSGSGAFWGFLVAIAVIGLLVGGAYYFKMPKSSPKAQPQKQQDRDTVPAFDEHGNIIRNGPRK